MTIQHSHRTLRIENLEIGYQSGSTESVFTRSSINYSAFEGEMVALIGPNGIGKSTLLKTIVGFQKPIGGDILFDNNSINGFSSKALARKISYVSTENVQVANMRVSDLVAFGRFPYTGWMGSLQPEDIRIVKNSMEATGMLPLAHKMVSQLSDGERQRAMIARALAQDTPLMILDEPTAFLDISNKYGIFRLLRNLVKQQRKTVILSTHDLNIALREADKLWIMLAGETLEGAPEDAVLHGWLNHLFQDDRIGFDAVEGDFFFRKMHAGTAVVNGTGLPYTLTVKALNRRGYEIKAEEPADASITILPDKSSGEVIWNLHREGSSESFGSLYSLLKAL